MREQPIMHEQPEKYRIFVVRCQKLKITSLICAEENKTEKEVALIFKDECIKKKGIKWEKTSVYVGKTNMLFNTMEEGEEKIRNIDGNIEDIFDLLLENADFECNNCEEIFDADLETQCKECDKSTGRCENCSECEECYRKFCNEHLCEHECLKEWLKKRNGKEIYDILSNELNHRIFDEIRECLIFELTGKIR